MIDKRPKVGIFDLTCCNGCEMTIINCEDELLDVVGALDIRNFRLARGTDSDELKSGRFREQGPFDLAIVEGTVVTEDEIKIVKMIRECSNVLMSLGTCNSVGGLPRMIMNDRIYPDRNAIRLIQHPANNSATQVAVDPIPMKNIVKVNFELRGCPIEKSEFLNAVKSILLGKIPEPFHKSVCFECKIAGNACIYTDTDVWLKRAYGKEIPKAKLIEYEKDLCMGPITQGNCGALCTSLGRGCQGCRGPVEDANIPAFIELLIENRMIPDDIERNITKFGGYIDEMKNLRVKTHMEAKEK